MTLTIRDDPRLAAQAVGSQPLWVVKATLDQPGSPRVVVFASHDGWRDCFRGNGSRPPSGLERRVAETLPRPCSPASSGAVPIGEPPWIQRAAGHLRAGLQRACASLPDRPGGLLPGLVIGDTSALDPVLEEQFRAAGMTHLVAVSGSNVAIIVGLVVLIARRARFGPGPTALVAALAVVGFVVLVRPSPSVLRAGLMGGIGLIALASGRSRAALPALSAAVTGLIVVDPELAGEAGFALSVLATGGLLLLAPPLRDGLRAKGFPAGVAEALAIPASAQLACAPVIAGLSGSVSLVSVPANLLAVPAVAPSMHSVRSFQVRREAFVACYLQATCPR